MLRWAVRHMITEKVEGSILLGTVTTMNSNNIRSNNLLHLPDDALNDGECFVYSGTGAGGSRRISDFAASNGEITPYSAFSPNAVAADLFEVHRYQGSMVADYNRAIDQAMQEAEDVYLADKIDTTLTMQQARFEYPIPSGFRFLGAVHMDTLLNASDIWGSQNYDDDQALFSTSANAKLAQAFVPDANDIPSGRWVGSVRLFLRMVGTYSVARTLTLTIETDSSGAPSGTQVTNASATLSSSSVSGSYGYADFAFTNPVWLTGDTTFHIVLSISGAADSTNYIAWGRDDSTQYGNGAAATGTAAPVWTTIASAALIFALGNPVTTGRYAKLAPDDWDVIRSDKLLWIRCPTEGRAIRLIGQGQATALSADTDSVGVPEGFIIAKAAGLMLAGGAGGPQVDPEARLQRAMYWEAVAEKARRRLYTQPRPNSRAVDAR